MHVAADLTRYVTWLAILAGVLCAEVYTAEQMLRTDTVEMRCSLR